MLIQKLIAVSLHWLAITISVLGNGNVFVGLLGLTTLVAAVWTLATTRQGRLRRKIKNNISIDFATHIADNNDRQNVINDPRGRVLARRIGRDVRAELAFPRRVPANQIIAAQRCRQYVEQHCTSLRHDHRANVIALATAWVFVPLEVEIEAADIINAPEVAEMEHHITSTHLNPDGGWIFWRWWTPSTPQNF